jgi:hypothetical protein
MEIFAGKFLFKIVVNFVYLYFFMPSIYEKIKSTLCGFWEG